MIKRELVVFIFLLASFSLGVVGRYTHYLLDISAPNRRLRNSCLYRAGGEWKEASIGSRLYKLQVRWSLQRNKSKEKPMARVPALRTVTIGDGKMEKEEKGGEQGMQLSAARDWEPSTTMGLDL